MAIPTLAQLTAKQKKIDHKGASWVPVACAYHSGIDPGPDGKFLTAANQGHDSACSGCREVAQATIDHVTAAAGP